MDTTQKNNYSGNLDRIAMVAGGLLLLGNGIRKGSFFRSLLGGYIAYRGIAGNKTFAELCEWTNEQIASGKALNIRVSMVINRPRSEVYRAWRNLSNLPIFMEHLTQVNEEDELTSDWEMRIPGGLGKLRWKAEIVKERQDEMIAWQSVEGSEIRNAGKVGFREALGGEGTMVDVVLTYHAPMGKPGEKIAQLFTPMFKKMITQDIRNFKNFVEIGNYRAANATVFPE
jgi:Predicted integral membrane protein